MAAALALPAFGFNGRRIFVLLLALLFTREVAMVGVVSALAPAPAGLSDGDKALLKGLFLIKGDESLQEIYQATHALAILDSAPVEATSKIGESLKKVTFDSSEESFYALQTAAILRLPTEKILEKSVPVFISTLRNSRALLPLYYAVKGLQTAKTLGFIKSGDVEERTLEDTLNRVKSLASSDGTWSYVKGSKSTPTASGYAFEAVAVIIDLIGGRDYSSSSPVVKSMSNYVSKLYSTVETSDEGYIRLEDFDRSALIATSSVVTGILALADAANSPLSLSGERLAAAAYFLLSEGIPSSPSEAVFLVTALKALSRNSVAVPLVVSLVSSSLSYGADEKLKVSVKSPFGNPVSEVSVVATKATRVGQKKAILANKELIELGGVDSIYELDVSMDDFTLGKYEVKLSASPSPYASYYVPAQFTGVFKVTGVIDVNDVKLAIFDSDTGLPSKETSLAYDGTSGSAAMAATHLQKLRLSFRLTSPNGTPFVPQQALLKFAHSKSGIEHLYVAKREDDDDTFAVQLDFLEMMEKLYFLSGTYTFDLIAGDACMENPILWSLGALDLDLPKPTDKSLKIPAIASTDLSKYQPLKEIEHIFRSPEKLPPAYVSYSFCGLLLLPLLGFLFGLSKVGVNIKAFPSTGLPLVYSAAFVFGLLSILVVYALFWIKFNLFVTLKVLLPLGAFTAISGHLALSNLADSKKEKVA